MSTDLFSVHFLCNFTENIELKDLPACCAELWSCNWLNIIKSDFAVKFCNNNLQITTNFNDIDDEKILQTAIAFLLVFVQENFTGPRLNEHFEKYYNEHFSKERNPQHNLSVDSEEINANVKYPKFLLCSKTLFENLWKKYPNSIVINWWMLRVLCIHQKIIDQLTNTIYVQFKKNSDNIFKNIHNINENIELTILLLVEISQGFLIFHRTEKYEEIFKNICDKFNIVLTVDGLLGFRTKYQQKALPQLCLKVSINEENSLLAAGLTNKTVLPKLLKNEDDLRLEKIKFINENDNDVITIPSVLQTLVLSKLKHVIRSQPKDLLASEEIEPYITTLLYQESGPFTVRLVALFLNIAQEANHKRTVERCLKQSEDVSNIFSGEKFTNFERLSFCFAADLPPHWLFKKQLGDLMVSLGFVKSALDIYIDIQSMEDVLECYNHLELYHLTAETIQKELCKQPSAKLYCLLGDATKDVQCYETAWKLSNETSSLVQRHWGNYYFAKKNYELALPHLEKTLEINSLQEVQWLRLGYAAMYLEKWELAVHAYLTYTHLEPHGFESWNNLAKALIKLGDKKRAHKILSESLKCNYNNWKVWTNYMLVSIDTGNFEDSLNAYIRLSELREKENFIDIEVLEIVCNAIISNIPDGQGRPSERLRKKTTTILGQQCVKYSNQWKLFKLAAKIAETPLDSAVKLQKCFRAYVQKNPNWTQLQEDAVECLEICLEMCEKSLEAFELKTDSYKLTVKSQISSARLAAQACIRSMETRTSQLFIETDSLLKKLKDYFNKLTNIIKENN